MNLRYDAYFICPKIARKPYLSLKLLASHLLNYFRASENWWINALYLFWTPWIKAEHRHFSHILIILTKIHCCGLHTQNANNHRDLLTFIDLNSRIHTSFMHTSLNTMWLYNYGVPIRWILCYNIVFLIIKNPM